MLQSIFHWSWFIFPLPLLFFPRTLLAIYLFVCYSGCNQLEIDPYINFHIPVGAEIMSMYFEWWQTMTINNHNDIHRKGVITELNMYFGRELNGRVECWLLLINWNYISCRKLKPMFSIRPLIHTNIKRLRLMHTLGHFACWAVLTLWSMSMSRSLSWNKNKFSPNN